MKKQKGNIFCFSCIFASKVVPLPLNNNNETMELQCPQCGKWMAVSREELLMHDSQVVCPQCLAVCRYENDQLVVRDDSEAPYRHTATVAESPHVAARYCYSCGKQLPEGISFCPYCGADLSVPFGNVQQPAVEVKPTPKPEPVEKPSRAERRVEQASTTESERAPVIQVEDKLRSIARHYSDSGMRLQQHGTMPSATFRIVAYSIIVLLVALLIYIIIAGNSIEPAV